MDHKDIIAALAAPFAASEIKWKPATVSGNRALALAYVDARVIQDRLDAVLGVTGWQDDYTVLPAGSVVCKLSCKIGEDWITKMDVGSLSEQPDDGDKMKTAFSDALKRAAVKFGVGRFLYRLPSQWVDYDPQKRQFVTKPSLPGYLTGTIKAQKPANVREAALAILRPASVDGTESLGLAWKTLSADMRLAVEDIWPKIKAFATSKDKEKVT